MEWVMMSERELGRIEVLSRVVDGQSIIRHVLEIAQMAYLTGARELEADKKRRIDELHQDQLEALDATLVMMTGNTPWIGDLGSCPEPGPKPSMPLKTTTPMPHGCLAMPKPALRK